MTLRLSALRACENAPQLTVSYRPAVPLDQVASLWQSVEAGAHPSFFLSWHWVGCWLREAGMTPDLLVAHCGDKPVGIVLLCREVRRWPIPSFHLTSAGCPRLDAPFIEYNGLVVDRDLAAEAGRVLIAALAALPRFRRRSGGWWLLFLPGIDGATRDLCEAGGLRLRDQVRRPSPFIDLNLVRQEGGDFLATRSRNFRGQVRRSLRLYEDEAPTSLKPATDLAEAFETLEALKTLHQHRWNKFGQPGAFSLPFFESFHRALVADAWPAGKIDLLRLDVGGRIVGCLYNFVHKGIAYAYQSGFDFASDARFKPGLVSHCLAVERYLRLGLDRYLLLAGESDYKTSLANGNETLHWAVARRSGLLDATVDLADRIVRRVVG
jgi:CelD/BcsL family acetyltransferase involved in cellulose biosynthesis